ncbi:MAG: hypothetical protein C0410_08905 [Anaerolinea sp.]|nr:hypothetical protein [Anaerolinea sp.]
MKTKLFIGLLIIMMLNSCGLAQTMVLSATPTQTSTPPPTTPPTPDTVPTTTPVLQNSTEGIICGDNQSIIALLVDPNLTDPIRAGLSQFEADLCSEGYSVIESTNHYNTPPELRAFLLNLYVSTDHLLEGAILIGDMPHAYQWVTSVSANPNIPTAEEETISFQYYSDLDGTFSVSPNYVSPGNHEYSYDIHEGNINWEIWTSVLPYYKGSLTETVNALNRYFTKNHDYRKGAYNIPPAFMRINELNSASSQTEQDSLIAMMQNDPTAWMPLSDSVDARLYLNGPSLSVEEGYQDLIAGIADITVVDAHGWSGGSGRIDIPWVEGNPVKTVIFWTSGCSTGDIDVQENFTTSIVYSPSSMVLLAEGSTNDSGGLGTNENGFFGQNIATALSQGKNFGQAILSHVNVPLIYPWSESREFHFANLIIVGDPTLKIRP